MNTEPSKREEAPERIWIDAAPHLIADAMRHIYVEPPPPHFRDFNSVEYVRADLFDGQTVTDDAISRSEAVSRIERQIRLWNNDTVTMACADMLADIKQLPASDAATRMRERCVARVKGMKRSVVGITDPKLLDAVLRRNTILSEVVIELESLTLDEKEPTHV